MRETLTFKAEKTNLAGDDVPGLKPRRKAVKITLSPKNSQEQIERVAKRLRARFEQIDIELGDLPYGILWQSGDLSKEPSETNALFSIMYHEFPSHVGKPCNNSKALKLLRELEELELGSEPQRIINCIKLVLI